MKVHLEPEWQPAFISLILIQEDSKKGLNIPKDLTKKQAHEWFISNRKKLFGDIDKRIGEDKVPSYEWADRISTILEFYKDEECTTKIPNQKVAALLSPYDEE